MTTGISLTEARHPGSFMVSEAPGRLSRDVFTVALSQTLVAGQVVGKLGVTASITSSAAADSGNTGNGTFTLDGAAPVSSDAKNGKYRVVNELVSANSGEFVVYDPAGIEIGRVAVGATFNNQIKFVIADGATDFAIGDAFTVEVDISESEYQVAAFNPTGTDGSERVAGIMWDNVTTDGSNTQQAVLIVRNAEVRGVDLTWPNGITTAQQTEATRALEQLDIILR